MGGNKWERLRKTGAVFTLEGEAELVFETAAVYDSPGSPSEQEILAWVWAQDETSRIQLTTFPESDCPRLNLLKNDPRHLYDGRFMRSTNTEIVYLSGRNTQKWLELTSAGAVFEYSGPRVKVCGVYETFFTVYLPDSGKKTTERVAIARAHNQNLAAEFTAADLLFIKPLEEAPQFVERRRYGVVVPALVL